MKPKTEEFLGFLLWSASSLMRPTFRNLTESYESWAYRTGFARQIAKIEGQGLVERDSSATDSRVYRLTHLGRLEALGGRDPEARWGRSWDGRWRMVLFDIPVKLNTQRVQLRRHLQGRCFGRLQDSIWLTPDSMDEEREAMILGKVNAGMLTLIDARPCAGETDTDLVIAAWDFEAINDRYAELLQILDECPQGPLVGEPAAKDFRRWAAKERRAWFDAVTIDPLLPRKLLPSSYLGERAWRRRIKVLRKARRLFDTFQL